MTETDTGVSERCPICGEEGASQEREELVPLLCENGDCTVFAFDPRDRKKAESVRTRVGHTQSDDIDVYVGRGSDNTAFGDVPPGENGGLGNPYRLADYTREESLERFRADFEAALENGPNLKAYVASLHGKVLGCWCRTLAEDTPACHADIIAEHADRLASDLLTTESEP